MSESFGNSRVLITQKTMFSPVLVSSIGGLSVVDCCRSRAVLSFDQKDDDEEQIITSTIADDRQ